MLVLVSLPMLVYVCKETSFDKVSTIRYDVPIMLENVRYTNAMYRIVKALSFNIRTTRNRYRRMILENYRFKKLNQRVDGWISLSRWRAIGCVTSYQRSVCLKIDRFSINYFREIALTRSRRNSFIGWSNDSANYILYVRTVKNGTEWNIEGWKFNT